MLPWQQRVFNEARFFSIFLAISTISFGKIFLKFANQSEVFWSIGSVLPYFKKIKSIRF